MSFARSTSNKYGKKLVDTATKPATDAIKATSKRAIQKTAEATVDLIDNNIADKITSVSKKNLRKNLIIIITIIIIIIIITTM